ncbi:VTC domain-containing protein [Candidatus Pelagibacter sp.]|jgi:hypothetical protein|nr:VTC domain-containing protein [Candidatus Pelagibacter sp.]|tara:strand:+ start:3204 stop:3815 length:612 start_codon:yes stop_codon:yes gene_type:complete
MRNEIKYVLKKNEVDFFLKKIKLKNLHPPRFVYSIYFDTKDLVNFTDSEEGTVPRTKWRIRVYSKNLIKDRKIDSFFQNEFMIEKKETFEKYRDKQRIILKNTSFEKSIKQIKEISNQNLVPNVFITYYRKYYSLNKDIRLTHDMNIKFFKVNKKGLINEKNFNDIIIEEKKPILSKDDTIFNIIGDKHSRNSKYCEAIKAIF